MRNWRINTVLVVILIFSATIVGRLVFLQIIQHDYYLALARGQQTSFRNSLGDRGEIFLDNHALPVATNQDYTLVYVSPATIPIEEKDEVAEVLINNLNLGKDYVKEKLNKDNLYEVIKDRLSQEEIKSLKETGLTSIYFSTEKIREYPYEDFASHLLGFVNKDGQGQYGAEEYWDDLLRGEEKFWEGIKAPLGYFFPGIDREEGRGKDLTLTVDYNIQYFAEKLLKRTQEDLDVDGGTIIVIDPRSGKMLAMANLPGFDPGNYSDIRDFEIFQSESIQKIFEPGSVFKPITMAAALDQEKITPQTTYQDPGILEIGGWPIYNYEQRIYPGDITMTEVLEKSINTGAVFAETQVGHKKFEEYIEKFGVFEKTEIDLYGEVCPSNTEFKKGHEINYATASFGQGIEMTPIQLVRAFSVIANGGKLVKPYVVETQQEISDNNVISNKTASKLTAMLVSVVENGFGKAARVPGYYIAGKTGTAQISYSALGISKSGYSDETWQSFIGFAPAFNPQFLILVKLNNPATKTAEYSAVPLFQELAKYIIDYYQIPPDYE